MQEEELPQLEQEEIVEIDAIRQWFEKGEIKSLRENLGNQMRFKVVPHVEALKKEIEWDKYLVHATKSGRKAYEFSLKYEKSLVPKSVLEGQEEWSGERLFISERVLFFPEGEDDYRIGIFKFYASGNNVNLNEQDFLKQFNVKHQSSELSGLIEEYSWEEKFIKGYQIKNGEFTHTRKRISKEEREFLNSANIQICSGYLVEYCTIYSVVGTNPDGSSWSLFQSMGDCFEVEEGIQCLFQDGDNPWPDDGPLPVDGPGGGDGPPKSDCTNCCFDPITGLVVECEELDEDQIIKDLSFKGTKADCVYEKLLDLSGGFKNAIKKFDGEFPVAHLKFLVDYDLANTTNAITRDGGDFMIEILFNGNTLNDRTNLGLARTFIHEVIHAEMYRKIKSVNGSISVTDFPGIYDYYRRHIKNWQHEQMASHYRVSIASMLQEFATGIPLSSHQSPDQFYLDMSWVGLQRTLAWDELDDDEKIRIISIVNNHSSSGNKICY